MYTVDWNSILRHTWRSLALHTQAFPLPSIMGPTSRCEYRFLQRFPVYQVRFLAISVIFGSHAIPVSLMDLGFGTHGVHMDQRLVKLVATLSLDRTSLSITAPPSGRHFPPGPAFLYVVTDAGVPSFGHRTIIGTGASPPMDHAAIAK